MLLTKAYHSSGRSPAILLLLVTCHLSLVTFSLTGCGFYSSNLAKEYNDFGVKCAKMGLWNEAMMRWKRAVEIAPNNPQIHSNLGVAYESKGDFPSALSRYQKAIELDPENRIYKSNYAKCKKNYERNAKDSRPKT